MAELNEQPQEEQQQVEIPDKLPLLPIRDIVIFPYMILPLFVGRDMSIKAIDDALSGNRLILLVAQKDLNTENPDPKDLYPVGTVGMIMRMLKLPDGRVKVLVQGMSKARIKDFVQTEPYFLVNIEKITEPRDEKLTLEAEALMRNVKEQLEKMITLGKMLLPDIMVIVENIDDPGKLADLVASNLGLKVDVAQEVLEILDPKERLIKVNEIISKELEVLTMQQKIQASARGEIDKSQREYFLREQLKAIQKELGETDERTEEINDLRKKVEEAKMPEKVLAETEKQLKRLERMHPDAAESAVIRSYIETLAELPWSNNHPGQPGHQGREEDTGRRPLRPGEGQGQDTRIPGGAEAERQA